MLDYMSVPLACKFHINMPTTTKFMYVLKVHNVLIHKIVYHFLQERTKILKIVFSVSIKWIKLLTMKPESVFDTDYNNFLFENILYI